MPSIHRGKGAGVHLIAALAWSADLTLSEVWDLSVNFTDNWLQPLRDATTPGAGAYASEADNRNQTGSSRSLVVILMSGCTDSSSSSTRLGFFYARNGVGIEGWYVTGQLEGLPIQSGRQCRV